LPMRIGSVNSSRRLPIDPSVRLWGCGMEK
jgi:hypothetical protein